MPDATLVLGAAVIKAFFRIWLKDNAVDQDAALTLTDLIEGKISDARQQRKVKRLLENLEERVADQILVFMNTELRDVPDNEREAAVYAATLTFNDAVISVRDIAEMDLDSIYLERMVRKSSGARTRDLSAGAVELYNRIITQCCSYIVEISGVLPGFETGVFSVLLSRETEILNRVSELLDRIDTLSQHDGVGRFEHVYRQAVAKKLDHLELFGVTISDTVRTYPLSTAYVNLTVNSDRIIQRWPAQQQLFLGDIAADRPKEIGQNLSVEDALTSTRRLFLLGEAGTGKTTLLQWIAVRAALGDFKPPLTNWNSLVPFFVRFRKYAGQELPNPEDFLDDIGHNIAAEMPPGWVQEKLRDGSGVVLLDGIDELPESERGAAKIWLRDLLDNFPDSRFVVSSRPAAVPESWLDLEQFDPAEVQPMDWPDIQALIEQWHEAFVVASIDEEERAAIRGAKSHLLVELKAHRHLLQLAATPLLTALLCALNLDRRTVLPRDRMEIYRIALEMLLERRDLERKISGTDIELSRQDKMIFLEDLAYWLLRNGRSDAPFDRVAERFNQKLSSMPHVNADGRTVADFLLARSGVIRRPTSDTVDFLHRTFEEYLGAAAAVDADDIGVLVEHADDDQWREVIIMAAGHALFHQRNELFQGLLDRAARRPKIRSTIEVLTIACLETSTRLNDDILTRVEEVASRLLPPRNMDIAHALALSGGFVLDQMMSRNIKGARQAAATIRLAGLVGGEKSYELIRQCAAVGKGAPTVERELVRAWQQLDPEIYGRTVLNGLPISFLNVSDPALLSVLHYPKIEDLSLNFRHGHGDIRQLARLTTVKQLDISDPLVTDLSPLAAMEQLTDVSVYRTGQIALKDLPAERLNSLWFNFPNVVDPESLSSFVSLKTLGIFNAPDDANVCSIIPKRAKLEILSLHDAKYIQDLRSFMDLEPLDSLNFWSITEAVGMSSIAGIEKWADSLTRITLTAPGLEDAERLSALPHLGFIKLVNTPISDISFMAEFPDLWALHLGGAGQLPDLSPLRELGKLRALFLYGSDDVDLSPFAGKEDIAIYITQRRSRRITGSNMLGRGSKISNLEG